MPKVFIINRREISFCDYPIENECPEGVFSSKEKAEAAKLEVARNDLLEGFYGGDTSYLLDDECYPTRDYTPEIKKWVDDIIESMDQFPEDYDELDKIDLGPFLKFYADNKYVIWDIEVDSVPQE